MREGETGGGRFGRLLSIRWRRVLGFLVAAAVLTTVGLPVAGAYGYVRVLTRPGCPGSPWTPERLGLAPEPITVHTHDNLRLDGWWLPPDAAPNAAIILLPGWAGDRNQMLVEAEFLHRHGYGVLTVDTRNCAGAPTTLGHYEIATVKGALDYVKSNPDVDPRRIGVLGFSAGAATAILAAAETPDLGAVVAAGNFYDLARDITEDNQSNGPLDWFTQRMILFFFWQQTGVRAEDVSPIDVIGQISPRPVFLIFGSEEIASARGQDQYAAAGEPKTLWIVPGAGHGGYLGTAPAEYERRIVEFFDGALP